MDYRCWLAPAQILSVQWWWPHCGWHAVSCRQLFKCCTWRILTMEAVWIHSSRITAHLMRFTNAFGICPKSSSSYSSYTRCNEISESLYRIDTNCDMENPHVPSMVKTWWIKDEPSWRAQYINGDLFSHQKGPIMPPSDEISILMIDWLRVLSKLNVSIPNPLKC